LYGPEELANYTEDGGHLTDNVCFYFDCSKFKRLIQQDDDLLRKRKSSIAKHQDAQPWIQLAKLNASLNRELEEFFEMLIDNYVNSW
jgi:hypothetical protein